MQALVTAGKSAKSFEKGLELSVGRRDNPVSVGWLGAVMP